MSFEICLQEDPEKGNVVISIEINRLSGGKRHDGKFKHQHTGRGIG